MDKLLLKFVRLFIPLLQKQGVDTDRMFAIVETKLLMDKRRTYIQYKNYNKKQKETGNHLNGILIMYAIFSIFIAAMIFVVPSFLLSMIFFHSYILFMMAMTLITDFSTVLLDTTDNQIILPRPVTGKTLFVSRMVHVCIYLFQFAIAIAALPLVAVFIKARFFAGFAAIITTFSTVLLAVFLTYILYLLILQYASEQKLKEVITYFQIFMTVFFAAGYQIIPRLINIKTFGDSFTVNNNGYYFAPPVWMAETIEAVTNGLFDVMHIVMMGLAILLPAFLFWIMNKYLAPSFTRKLAALNVDGVNTPQTTTEKTIRKKTISEKLSKLICKTEVERAAFELTWKVTGRDKQFKMQFYPSLAYLAIFIFIIIFRSNKSVESTWNNLANTKSFLMFIYIPILLIGNSLMFVAYSENYQAAWVYRSSPIIQPGNLVSGTAKAMFTKFFLPAYLLLFSFCIVIWHTAIIDDFLLGLVVNLFCFLCIASLSSKSLPFSKQPNTQLQSGKFILVIIQMIIIGAMIGLHLLTLYFPFVFYVLLPILAVASFFLIRNLQQLQWNKISM
jgi:hypothetical protein